MPFAVPLLLLPLTCEDMVSKVGGDENIGEEA